MNERVYGFVCLFYWALYAVPIFILFDSEKGCSGRLNNAFWWGIILTGITLYNWWIPCILILSVGLYYYYDGKKHAVYIAAALALVTALAGIRFRSETNKKTHEEGSVRVTVKDYQALQKYAHEQREQAEREENEPEPKSASESASQSSPKPVVETASSAPTAAAYADKQVGDRFEFGHYPQGPNGEVQPITWRVLKRESDALLVISELCLDAKKYNNECETIPWSECSLRRWLNGEFLQKAFNGQEQALIKTSRLANNAGPSTEDRIFLLSIAEARHLFANDEDREVKPTAYAIKNGVYAIKYDIACNGNTWWWLRSSYGSFRAAIVNFFGEASQDQNLNVDNASGSVRPAFRIALNGVSSEAAKSTPAASTETSDSAPAASLSAVSADKQVVERFEFGRYPQGANGEVKPITWRVLKRESDALLVISELCLDAKPYNKENKEISWSDCTLRRWLNGEFIQKAFNGQEQSLIKTSRLNNNAGPSTEDRVFLLSIEEAESIFANDEDRKAKPTAYAIKKHVYVDDGNTGWWLRSRGYSGNDAADVYSGGGVIDFGDRVDYDYGSVRPAFRIALNGVSSEAAKSTPAASTETSDSAPVASLRAVSADKQVGELFEFGRYPQGPNGEVEPITWRVLKRESDSLLVISELCLDAEPYNDGKMAVSWSKCTLRRWLNDEFLHKAFSSSEQALIRTSKLENNAGPATEDLVFLLSEDEAKSLIVNTDGSKARPTAYAIESGADTYDSYAWWWLRSRGSSDDSAARVGSYGNINSYYVNSASGSVRPAFRIVI